MLIFDGFKTRAAAEHFIQHVATKFSKRGKVCDSQEESDRIDPFPYVLNPPIALVERSGGDAYNGITAVVALRAAVAEEKKVADSVKEFGGVFAGT